MASALAGKGGARKAAPASAATPEEKAFVLKHFCQLSVKLDCEEPEHDQERYLPLFVLFNQSHEPYGSGTADLHTLSPSTVREALATLEQRQESQERDEVLAGVERLGGGDPEDLVRRVVQSWVEEEFKETHGAIATQVMKRYKTRYRHGRSIVTTRCNTASAAGHTLADLWQGFNGPPGTVEQFEAALGSTQRLELTDWRRNKRAVFVCCEPEVDGYLVSVPDGTSAEEERAGVDWDDLMHSVVVMGVNVVTD